MYKIQIKEKYGWKDVRDYDRSGHPIKYFNTETKASTWRLFALGVGSDKFTRVVSVDAYDRFVEEKEQKEKRAGKQTELGRY